MKAEDYLKENGVLVHHGVKGMHWGVHKKEDSGNGGTSSAKAPSKREGKKALKEEHKQWKKGAQSSETANAIFQDAVKTFAPQLKIINNDANYKGKDLTKNPRLARNYDATVSHYFNQHLAQTSVDKTFNAKFGRAYVYQLDRATGMLRGTEMQAHMEHADAGGPPDFKVDFDELGQVVGIHLVEVKHDDFDSLEDMLEHFGVGSIDEELDSFENDFLEHFGVKGMHWGVRKDAQELGVTHKTAAAAKKDAEEFTRAKLFYGEGAGTRRKLIKAKVEQRSKNDPAYKKAFDHYTTRTDLAKRADQARGERRRKDFSNSTRKTTRGIKNVLVGNTQNATVAAIGLVAAGKYAHDTGLDKQAMATGRVVVQNVLKNVKNFTHDDFKDLDEELAHYGVKGMHWGVRREVGSDGHVEGASSAAPAKASGPVSQDHAKAMAALAKANTHGLASLSTEEMRHLTNRLEAERKFHALTSEQKSEVQREVEKMRLDKEYRQLSAERAKALRSPGKKMVDALLGDLGSLATDQASRVGKAMINDMVKTQTAKAKGREQASRARQQQRKSQPKSNPHDGHTVVKGEVVPTK